MFKRMLSMSLGLALWAVLSVAVGLSSHSSVSAQEAGFATNAVQPGGTYRFKTEVAALQAKAKFQSQGRIVFGPFFNKGFWEIEVSN